MPENRAPRRVVAPTKQEPVRAERLTVSIHSTQVRVYIQSGVMAFFFFLATCSCENLFPFMILLFLLFAYGRVSNNLYHYLSTSVVERLDFGFRGGSRNWGEGGRFVLKNGID